MIFKMFSSLGRNFFLWSLVIRKKLQSANSDLRHFVLLAAKTSALSVAVIATSLQAPAADLNLECLVVHPNSVQKHKFAVTASPNQATSATEGEPDASVGTFKLQVSYTEALLQTVPTGQAVPTEEPNGSTSGSVGKFLLLELTLEKNGVQAERLIFPREIIIPGQAEFQRVLRKRRKPATTANSKTSWGELSLSCRVSS